MKFSEIDKQGWQQLQIYLDTCLLPVTGLSGNEQPWQVTEGLKELRDAMALVEIPFKGRVMTYPAFQYIASQERFYEELQAVGRNLKKAGFRYIVVITRYSFKPDPAGSLDLIISTEELPLYENAKACKERVTRQIEQMWN